MHRKLEPPVGAQPFDSAIRPIKREPIDPLALLDLAPALVPLAQHPSQYHQHAVHQQRAQLVQPVLVQQQQQSAAAGSASHHRHLNHLAFHNPFDLNSYPVTNPPILDSTMFLPYVNESGVPRRRRISISNGQIGQIVNHEAFFMDDDSFDEFYDPQFPDQRAPQLASNAPVLQEAPARSSDAAAVALFGEVDAVVPVVPLTLFEAERSNGTQARRDSGVFAAGPGSLLAQVGTPSTDPVAGVPPPNHLLIYNNEVIYNPNDGPIPGTAAWKKERLLERNRVAASKCRQRKKQAQQQLQDNMAKYESEIKDQAEMLDKYEKLHTFYNTTLSRYFDGTGNLEPLRKLINQRVGDIDIDL